MAKQIGVRLPISYQRPPLVSVKFTGPDGTELSMESVIDTGAGPTALPTDFALALGLTLDGAPESVTVAGGGKYRLWKREIEMCFGDGRNAFQWKGEVAITDAELHRPLLGWRGFLEHFNFGFDRAGSFGTLTFTANSSFPGTFEEGGA